MPRVQPEMEIHSDECVLRQIFQNVDKFLAGTINGDELFKYMYVVSKARLDLKSGKLNEKQVDSST
tara:strand:+ start:437 stop:634 length:198 start_codon:yes stop_codon:yes gene_type:complete